MAAAQEGTVSDRTENKPAHCASGGRRGAAVVAVGAMLSGADTFSELY